MTDVEQLLLDFNRNPDNRELQDFYSRKSMMEMMGVARSEVAHSAFLAWLLSGKDVCVHSADSPLMWLFQVLVLREYTSQSIFFSNDIKTRILNRSLGFEILEVVPEKKINQISGNYFSSNYPNRRPSEDKLDVYIKGRFDNGEIFEIFIENKILSPEEGPKSGKNMKLTGYDDQWQTQRYYQATSGNGNNLKLYVYLRPDKLSPVSKSACNCKQYIQICYQDLLDYILIPLTQNDDLAERSKILVQEYIDSLSIPTTDTSAHKRIVMASTQDEMKWINLFIERNKQLMFLMLKAMCSKKNSKLLSADEELLLDFAEYNKNLIYAIANMIEDKSVNLDDLYDYSKPVSGYLIEPLFAIFKDSSFGFEFAKRFAIHNESKVNSINDLNKLLSTEISLVTTGIYYNSSTIQLQCRKIDDFKKFDLYATTGTWQKGDKGLLTRLMNALNKNPLSYFSWTVI